MLFLNVILQLIFAVAKIEASVPFDVLLTFWETRLKNESWSGDCAFTKTFEIWKQWQIELGDSKKENNATSSKPYPGIWIIYCLAHNIMHSRIQFKPSWKSQLHHLKDYCLLFQNYQKKRIHLKQVILQIKMHFRNQSNK